MHTSLSIRRTAVLVLLLALIAGCAGERLVGTWEGTYDGEKHELEFTGTGRLRRSTDFIGGKTGWTAWEAVEEIGQKRLRIRAGGQKVLVTFTRKNEIRVYNEETGITIDMRRVIDEAEAAKDSRSYATAYLLLIFAVAFGLIAVCRPSRRAT